MFLSGYFGRGEEVGVGDGVFYGVSADVCILACVACRPVAGAAVYWRRRAMFFLTAGLCFFGGRFEGWLRAGADSQSVRFFNLEWCICGGYVRIPD